MQCTIEGAPAFAYINVDLEPGETVIAESNAMSSMAADLDMVAKFNGGFFGGLAKAFLGGESLFVNHFTNNTTGTRRVSLVQGTPGNTRQIDLNGNMFCLQPGAYIASTPDVKLGVKWAGFKSWFAKEGLFKLTVGGQGSVWYGAYGGLLEKEVDGEYIVDTSHLVGYEPQMQLKIQLAGGLFSSLAGGEGFVTRIEGKGKIIIQTRSLSGLADWVNPRLW